MYLRYGTYSVDLAINAGMELEMPGPPRWRTPLLVNHMLSCQKVLPSTIDERVTTLLEFVQRQAKRNPDVVFGDGQERSRDSAETRKFTRRLAADGMVLLKNEGGVLPLAFGSVKKVAIIGPNAKERIISGGGSAQLKASYVVSPYEGLVANAPEGIEFDYTVGCYGMSSLVTERHAKTESCLLDCSS
jgi:beta-glucosidase